MQQDRALQVVGATKAPAGISKLCPMAGEETKGSSARGRSCQVDQGLKFISSSGRQDLLPPTRSPAIPVHLLTPCHLLVPKGFLEALGFCPEVAAASALRLLEVAGPCLSPASFEPRALNTELGTLLTAGTKETQQDRVLALMELTSSGEMKQYSHKLANRHNDSGARCKEETYRVLCA